jgi:hypothetical protein
MTISSVSVHAIARYNLGAGVAYIFPLIGYTFANWNIYCYNQYAGGAIAASRVSANSSKTATAKPSVVNNFYVQGNLATERQLYENARRYNIQKNSQNS